MQFETDFPITARNEEPLQGSGYWEVNSRIHFLQRPLKLDRALSARYAVEVGGYNLVEPDFILEGGANGIRRHI